MCALAIAQSRTLSHAVAEMGNGSEYFRWNAKSDCNSPQQKCSVEGVIRFAEGDEEHICTARVDGTPPLWIEIALSTKTLPF